MYPSKEREALAEQLRADLYPSALPDQVARQVSYLLRHLRIYDTWNTPHKMADRPFYGRYDTDSRDDTLRRVRLRILP
jgi:hypothetical protein